LDLYSSEEWKKAPVVEAFETVESLVSGGVKTLAVDISSMPRKTLALFVEMLSSKVGQDLEVDFLYCPGNFDESSKAANVVVPMTAEPVSEFFSGALRPPSVPIGLIVGLGLERHRAAGIVELLEPARTWFFAAAEGDERFIKAAEAVNQQLLRVASQGDVFHYDIRSLAQTYAAVESLCFSSGLDYRLIMAPSGPKLFSLACLLVASDRGYARPAVWRVGSAGFTHSVDVCESGEVSASRVVFG
jgi:hypothetical protein